MNKYTERLYNGIVKENPTFVLMLGMCSTLAVTTSAWNGFGMGISTMVVLTVSNLLISLLRNVIPDNVRIPSYIVIVASLVTIVELLIKAYIPELYDALGIYIPLIVVNCIILGRAESYASKHPPLLSAFDGLGMGLGFTFALTCIGFFRELIGAGTLLTGTPFQMALPEIYEPISIFVLAPGAFLVLALLIAFLNALNIKNCGKKKTEGCNGSCLSCGQPEGCSRTEAEQEGAK